jgi:hypothetical protein
MEVQMIREQFINFLEAAVVLLMLINAFSVAAAAYAISLARAVIRTDSGQATQHRFVPPLARSVRVTA